METSFPLPDPGWDCISARSASASGSASLPLGRPLSPEGSSRDGGDAAKLSGVGRRGLDAAREGFPGPSAIPQAAPTAGRRHSSDEVAPQQPQPGGLTNAISRDLVAKLAAGTAPHKPRSRSSKALKAANRGKPKV